MKFQGVLRVFLRGFVSVHRMLLSPEKQRKRKPEEKDVRSFVNPLRKGFGEVFVRTQILANRLRPLRWCRQIAPAGTVYE